VNKLELINKLKQTDEVLLLELLEISSEELVDAFLEKINERIEFIYKEIQE
jgi:nucleoid DNA-binding protein